MQLFFSQKTINELLKNAKAETLLITSLVNIRYITGLSVSAGFILFTKKGCEFFVDSRYKETALQSVSQKIQIKKIEDLKERIMHTKKIAFEVEDVSVARLAHWQKKYKNTKFVQTSGLIEELRRTKTPEELKEIKRACAITKKILKEIPSFFAKPVNMAQKKWHLRRL
jgi:Xaa-Pro aminopeptidase